MQHILRKKLELHELQAFIFTALQAPPEGFEGEDFYSNLLLSENYKVLCETEQRLKVAGVNIEDMHVEPAPGQFEINFQPAWGILGELDTIRQRKC